MYKNNSRESREFMGFIPLQLSYNLTGMNPTSGYYSYTNRCVQFVQNIRDKQSIL